MPQIAQQDYKIIAPKDGRSFIKDAAALAELKKAVLNGIAFDRLIKNYMADEDTLDRVLGVYRDGSSVSSYDIGDGETADISLPYTVAQYQGLAAIQQAIDEKYGLMQNLPSLEYDGEDNSLNVAVSAQLNVYVCVDGKKIITTVEGDKIKALTLSETGPGEDTPFVNITWEDAQRLIGVAIL